MAITIDTTVGGAAANSYVTKAEVDEYAQVAADAAAWTAVPDTATKNIYIARAARLLDRLVRFSGERVDRVQKLEWPRDAVAHPTGCGYYEIDEIPQAVKDAQCELAIFLAAQGTTDPFATSASTSEFDSLKIGPIELDFAEGSTSLALGQSFIVDTIKPILAAGQCVARAGRLLR
jgi:hypothetical protein